MAKKRKSKLRENIETILSAILIALLIRIFLVEAYKIPSGSMIPTLIAGDHLLVNKFIYGVRIPIIGYKLPGFTSPKRGDIVVFHYPKYISRGWHREFVDLITFGIFGLTNTPLDPKNFIKRLIAIPGDIYSFDGDRDQITIKENGSDNIYHDVPFTYSKNITNTSLSEKVLKINNPKQIKNDIPKEISIQSFENEVLKKVTNQKDRELITKYYRLNQEKTNYDFDSSYHHPKREKDLKDKIHEILSSIDFIKPYYTRSQNHPKRIRGFYNDEILKTERFPISKNKHLEHIIQIIPLHPTDTIPFLYVPKKGDLLELKIVRNTLEEEVVQFYVNKKLLKSIGFKEYKEIYDRFYSGILPDIDKLPERTVSHTFKANYYFMMGDNRDNSDDSRGWGFVHEDYIIGTPLVIYWPFRRFATIPE